jgi:dTDP-4-dehydrorhamnose reductase
VRLLVVGAAGQLGTELQRIAPLHPAITSISAPPEAALDITDPEVVRTVIAAESRAAQGDEGGLVVANAAAWTNVDSAEEFEENAYAVNATAPALLATSCAEHGALLLHVSTDYVFAGDRVGGPAYRTDDDPQPVSAYGRTKLAGELAVRALHPSGAHVVRTAWVYGPGNNFVRTMARLATERETVDVVDDQRGSPTWARDLAAALLTLAALRPAARTWHVTGGGETTWYELARETFQLTGHDPDRVHPTTTDKFPRPAPRPAYSVLDGADWIAAGLPEPRPWQESLAEAIADGSVLG